MELIYFAAIITLACFVQAVAGFGLPMIATPVLVALFGIRATVPLMAIVILELQFFMIFRYHMALNIRTVWRISAAAILGIPIGVLFLSRIPEAITITLLGLILSPSFWWGPWLDFTWTVSSIPPSSERSCWPCY